ncbi:MAG: dihydropteroate synthase [Dehalococcoidia bacterium]
MESVRPPEPLRLGASTFVWGSRTYIVGIINATPDSFSGESVGSDPEAALRLAAAQVEAGADILDIGGESTRPGARPVAAEEELQRVIPVIKTLAAHLAVPLSIDTTKAVVAREALAAGAQLVNDINGFRGDPRLPAVVAEFGAAAVLMENGRGVRYEDLILEMIARLETSVTIATQAGVPRDRVILDPGLGFGKGTAKNLEIVRRLATFHTLGYSLLVGPSNKATIGAVLELPVSERLEGTAAMVAMSIANGADLVRVHNVKVMARVARMTDAIVRGYLTPGPLP